MRTLFVIIAMILLGVCPKFAGAQGGLPAAQPGPTLAELHRRQEMARRVPVTVALVDEMPAPDSIPVIILRRSNVAPYDVILVRRNGGDADQLAAAVLHLLVMRDRSGDTASVSSAFRLPRARRGPRAWDRSERPRMARVLARLQQSRPSDVPGVGAARATEIYLPSKEMRNAARVGRREIGQR
jgi:hypothetical protein